MKIAQSDRSDGPTFSNLGDKNTTHQLNLKVKNSPSQNQPSDKNTDSPSPKKIQVFSKSQKLPPLK